MSIGLRTMGRPNADDKLHSLIMGQTGSGKTHYGSTCPDPIGIGFDDRIYGVKDYPAININTVCQDVIRPISLDRKLGVFLANNPEFIDKIADDIKLEDGVCKLIIAFLKKQKMPIEALKKNMKNKLKDNESLIDEILGRTPFSKDEFDQTLNRISMRNSLRSKIFEKYEIDSIDPSNKSIPLWVFDVVVDEAIADGFKTINIDDGAGYVSINRNNYLEAEGFDDISDKPMGRGYYEFRKQAHEHLKSLMSKGVIINMFCHETSIDITDEKNDEKHKRYIPDVKDKELNEGLAKWFTLVGRATMVSNDGDEPPYVIDFTPKKYSLYKAPYRYGFSKPVPNDYRKIQELIKNKK